VAVRLRKLFVSRHMRAAYHRAHRRLWGVADSAVRAGVGDVILLPDGSWDVPMWESIDVMRDAGALLGVVQHDFIPLRHPDIVPERNLAPFRAWAAATLGRADFVMAVSETIATSFAAWGGTTSPPTASPRSATAPTSTSRPGRDRCGGSWSTSCIGPRSRPT
jgi:hypothetical protein